MPRKTRLWPPFAALPGAALLVVAGCHPTPRAPAPAPPAATQAAATFVGSEACAPCHPSEYRAEQASRHAHTMSLLAGGASPDVAPPIGRVGATRYAVSRAGARLTFGVVGKPDTEHALDICLGSGKNGTSFISVGDSSTLERMRMTYVPRTKRWEVHPGDETLALYAPPVKVEGQDARDCVGCHSTYLPAGTLRPEARFLGVTCEKCHGPGSAHIAAVRAGAADLEIASMRSWSARQINEACGKCHGKSDASGQNMINRKDTERWVSNALMQSRCFWQSGEAVSCLTCHSAHGDVQTDPRHYNAACLGCHGPTPGEVARRNPAARGNPCPSRPTGNCVGCHMPTGKFYPASDVPTMLTDHYIRPPAFMNAP